MYNVKVIEYPNGSHKKIFYKEPIKSGYKRDKENNVFEKAGEVADKDRSQQVSANRAKNAVHDISRSNTWEYFITFTFSSNKVNRYDYQDISKKVSQWLKDVKRRKYPDMKYLCVPELHKDGAYHFHALVSDGLNLISAKSSKNGSILKDNAGRQIYNVKDFKLGFTTATAVTDTEKVGSYLSKYITKDLLEHTPNKKRYWKSSNLQEPTVSSVLLDKDSKMYALAMEKEKADYVKVVDLNDINQTITYLEYNIEK